jgi:small-conductance mechanosensitive channel
VLLRLAQALGATVAFLVVLWLLGRFYGRIAATVERRTKETLAAHQVTDELARQTRVMQYLRRAVLGLVGLLGLTVTYVWSTFVLQLFPYTRPWGEMLRGFLVGQAVGLGSGLLAALPSMFTVLLIVLLTRFAIRIVNLVFAAAEAGRITIPGVYAETASLTQKLAIALLWLFALVIGYPYLPGSQTDAFKGISVFIGLIISLGSSGLMNQVMSGFTVTYSRALRRGDFVRVGELEGTVTHIGALSTKIETPRREEVTIPNAVLVSQMVTNYSRNADSTGVYTSTSVTIGYDTPWRQIEALLLLAASRTEGVRTTPPPVVLQSGLEDFYVRYTLLVSLELPQRRAPTLNRLHANIQDAFNEHGVQIMSPNYEADPDNRKIVPKDKWFAAPATSTQDAARITFQS